MKKYGYIKPTYSIDQRNVCFPPFFSVFSVISISFHQFHAMFNGLIQQGVNDLCGYRERFKELVGN